MDTITAVCEMSAALSWGAGIVALTLVGIVFRIEAMGARVREIKAGVESAHVMHEHADDYGFGTGQTNRLLREVLSATSSNSRSSEAVARSINELTHYLTWDIKQRTGETPPPPPPVGG